MVVDSLGHPTTHRFNNNGYLIAQTAALGQTTTFARLNGTNLLTSVTDPLARVTRFTYDAADNVTSIIDPAGIVRAFTYEPTFNKVTSITDPLGNVTRFAYDLQGNLTSITDPLGAVTQIAYNAFGQPVSTTDALGNVTQFAYSAQGDLATITDPLGNTTTRAHDVVSSLLLSQADPRGFTTTFTYDAVNRLTQIVDALKGITELAYDGNGNLLTVTDARGSTITHEYDSMDRLSRRIDPLGAPETFAYDGMGNLTRTTDRKGQTTTFTYDAVNRRVQSTFADGAVGTFTYDSAGRLIEADDTADPHRPIALAYDALDRLLAENTALGVVSYQYDALGRRTQMTVSGQNPVTYTYDANSRLRTITQAPLTPVDLQYDALNRRTRLTLPNGVSTEYQYDPASRLTALIYRNATGVLGDLQYTYDPSGNKVGIGGTFARTLLPDAVASATYDAANRQLAFGAKAMTYDLNGSLATLTEGAAVTTLTWDAGNRLTALGGATLGSFAYDALSRRASKTISGMLTTFRYDRLDIVREAVGATAVAYLRGLTLDEPFARDGSAFYLADGLGSTLQLTDPAGLVTSRYAYDPYGRTVEEGAAAGNPFQFTGRENDGTGLYYLRARYYAPGQVIFTSEHPLGLEGGSPNLYQYALRNPTTMTDRLGLQATAPSLPRPVEVPVPDPGKELGKRFGASLAIALATEAAEQFLPAGDLREVALGVAAFAEIGQGIYLGVGAAGLGLASAGAFPANPGLGVVGLGAAFSTAAVAGTQISSGTNRLERVLAERYRRLQMEEIERLRRERGGKQAAKGEFGTGR